MWQPAHTKLFLSFDKALAVARALRLENVAEWSVERRQLACVTFAFACSPNYYLQPVS